MDGKSSISRVRAVFAVAALAMGVLLFVGCAATVPQADYDAVKAQLTTQEQKAAALQQQLSANLAEATTLQQQIAAKEGDVKAAQEKLAAKETEIADLKKTLGASAGVTMLIGAKQLPTPTPRPAPTPLPAGAPTPTPAPPSVVPPEVANQVLPFTFYVETLATTSLGIDGWASTVACVPNTVFKRGMKLVWRFEVFDTSTGKRVTNLDAPTIKIRLPHGEELTARYSKRGGVGPWTWATGWNIPLDYPLGAFDYQIAVTKGDRTGTFDQDNVALVRAATATAAGIDSRVQIIP